jgi:hydroxymethylpyrimidine pyrophosphatase-like HAD family hydrolase
MYISCLATDYDGTLARDGIVDEATADALIAFRRSGRRLLLVTGRELPDLTRVFPRIDLFDRVVAENGALLFDPATRKESPLAPEPSPEFVETLRKKGVSPLSVGRSIVATWEPNEKLVLEAIREHGLELQIVFNKGAVMVLPPGVNKASGLKAACEDLGLSAHNVVSVGDAENDHAFLQASGYAVAVANALPAIKDEADLITKSARGAGVAELIEAVLKNDVDAFHSSETHNSVEVGVDAEGRPIVIRPHGGSALRLFGRGQIDGCDGVAGADRRRRLSDLRLRSGGRLCRVSLGRRVWRREGGASTRRVCQIAGAAGRQLRHQHALRARRGQASASL